MKTSLLSLLFLIQGCAAVAPKNITLPRAVIDDFCPKNKLFFCRYRSVKDNLKNIVSVFSLDAEKKLSVYGSGFVASKNGLIFTAKHLLNHPRAKEHFVFIAENNQVAIKKVVWKLFINSADLALIKVNHQFGSAVKLRESLPRYGEPIYTIGHPMSTSLGDKPSLGYGYFFKNWPISLNSEYAKTLTHLYSALPNAPGFSGSPIFDRYGDVLGLYGGIIIVQKRSDQSFVWAVPVKYLKMILELRETFSKLYP